MSDPSEFSLVEKLLDNQASQLNSIVQTTHNTDKSVAKLEVNFDNLVKSTDGISNKVEALGNELASQADRQQIMWNDMYGSDGRSGLKNDVTNNTKDREARDSRWQLIKYFGAFLAFVGIGNLFVFIKMMLRLP